MIKKAVSLLLALNLLLALLSACQSPSDLETPLVFSALELAEAVSGAATDAPNDPEQFDSSTPELLNTYIEAAYGLPTGEWKDCAVIMATGVRAYEIAVLRFANEAAAKHGVECVEQYLVSREGAFFGYAPEQAALVSNAVVCREGLYVGLFICEDPAAAKELFTSILKTGVLPEPTPTPEQEPEAEQPVDMVRLMVGIIESCIDEINTMGGVSYTISSPQNTPIYFPGMVIDYFGIDAGKLDSVEAGFIVDTLLGNEAFGIHVLCMTDETAAEQALGGMGQYRAGQEAYYLEKEQPENAERMAAGVELRSGRYLARFIGADPEAMAAAFGVVLERLETEQLPELTAEPQPTLNTEAMRELGERLDAIFQVDKDAADIWNRGTSANTLFIEENVLHDYNIPADQWESCFITSAYYTNGSNNYSISTDGDAFEAAVLCMTDEAAAIRGMAGLQLRAWSILWKLETGIYGTFAPPETVNVGSCVVRNGRYLALFVCRDPEAAEAGFEAALGDLLNIRQADDTQQEDTTPHGTAESPLFLEVNWAEREGDSDPDYPGRLLYVQPEEHMTRYDTSDILAAWEKRDPTGLSRYDRTIYDNAGEVLGELLHNGMSDFEKEVAIYDWVTQNLSYDWTHQDPLEETPETSYTPYGGLVEHMGVCLGYASTFELLMDMAGVECITVIGASLGSTEAHAWNMVQLDGEWYCADPTWDKDCVRWEWRFFNVTTEFMVRSNHQWDYAGIPEATATDHGRR